MNAVTILLALLGSFVGVGFTLLFSFIHREKQGKQAEDIVQKAKEEAASLVKRAEEKLVRTEEEEIKRKTRLDNLEERLFRREKELLEKEDSLRLSFETVKQKSEELKDVKEALVKKEKELEKEKEEYLGVSKQELFERVTGKILQEEESAILSRLYKLGRDGDVAFEVKARDLLVNAVYRIANTEVASFTTSTVELLDPEVKGKIIGKEGRNIKAFERATGVELLVDESPNVIVISCFDPVRRAVAKNALELLIKDGRIQPAKIEECVEKAKRDIGLFMKQKGEEAVLECGLVGIPDTIIPLLGRLYFRTSYGQNVLNHSIEMAHIAGVLAVELGADVQAAKAGALLHDIGKAVDHEISGTHVEIGRKILMKYGVSEKIIQAMQSHHEEYPYETIESVIVQVADAVSGGRPGARRDTVERYIERLSDLEAIALAFQGIEKAYALQAGREMRIFVSPALVSDLEARSLARAIAQKVEEELRFPGEIKIMVVRESQVVEFAR